MGKQHKIPRAGFLPYYMEDGTVYIKFMRPSNNKYGGDDFQIAKGKVDEGEDSKQAAIREASEELGMKEDNLIQIDFLGQFLGYTDIYYGEVWDKDDFGEFTYETGDTRWMTIDEFLREGRGIHKPIVKAFARRIGVISPEL